MIFAQKLLAPGPGTKPRATFRWRPFQSALSGSLFFKPPALPEVMTSFPPSLPFLSLRQKTLLSPPLGPKGEISDVAVEGVRFDFFQDVPYAR